VPQRCRSRTLQLRRCEQRPVSSSLNEVHEEKEKDKALESRRLSVQQDEKEKDRELESRRLYFQQDELMFKWEELAVHLLEAKAKILKHSPKVPEESELLVDDQV